MKKVSVYASTIIVLILVTYISYNLYHNNKFIDFKSYYNVINKNPEMEYLSLEEIRDEKEKVLEKLYSGYYENLSAEHVIVSLSDGDYVTEMKEYDGGVYHGITDPKEMYEEEIRVIHYFLGDDLDAQYIFDANALRNNGDNLEDKYELDNGIISISDAIRFAEYYWAECIPYDTTEGVEKKVRQVEVYQFKNGKYCICHEMTREFKGLMFEYEYPFENRAALSWWFDNGRTIMVDTDDIDELIGEGNGFEVEETGKKSYEVVSMKSAMDKVSNEMGNNSKYEVQRIEMVYRQQIVAYEDDYAEFKGIPCWRIQCKNQSNDMITMFYINLFDGNISYSTE